MYAEQSLNDDNIIGAGSIEQKLPQKDWDKVNNVNKTPKPQNRT